MAADRIFRDRLPPPETKQLTCCIPEIWKNGFRFLKEGLRFCSHVRSRNLEPAPQECIWALTVQHAKLTREHSARNDCYAKVTWIDINPNCCRVLTIGTANSRASPVYSVLGQQRSSTAVCAPRRRGMQTCGTVHLPRLRRRNVSRVRLSQHLARTRVKGGPLSACLAWSCTRERAVCVSYLRLRLDDSA